MEKLILKRGDKWAERLLRSFISCLTVFVILVTPFLPNISFAQEFGCFDIESINNNVMNGIYDKRSAESVFYDINWKEYSIESVLQNGYFISYYNDKSSCSKTVKMEGPFVNGLQEGKWKLYLNRSNFFQGNFINGKKEGVWLGYNISYEGDSVCYAKIEFKNNLIDGKAFYYFFNGRTHRIVTYQDGIKNGPEIEYLEKDTNKIPQVEEYKEYTNGVLNGKYLECNNYDYPDTLEYGTYLNGKRNGKFIFNRRHKLIVNFFDNQVDGKLLEFYANGQLALEADYKNNLPFNVIQIKDSCGKLLESNTLKEGNGRLNYYGTDGSLISSFTYKDQMISGKFSRYYRSGNIMEEGLLFTNDEKNFKKVKSIERCDDLNLFSAWLLNFTQGTHYTIYNENKSIRNKFLSEYCDSLNDDIIICNYYEKGKLKQTKNLWHGLTFGQVICYYINDSIEMKGNYKIAEGENGTKTSEENGVFTYYHSNGRLKAAINYFNGKEIGKSFYYDDSGSLKRTKVIEESGEIYNIFEGDTVNRTDINGKRQGKWINIPYAYSENNCQYLPNHIKYYKDDYPIGTWEYFDYDGKSLTERLIWQDSLIAYCWKWAYNGRLIGEGTMYDELENGEWKLYDFKKGFLQYKGHYKCGKEDGIWQEFNKRGRLIKEMDYREGLIINKSQ